MNTEKHFSILVILQNVKDSLLGWPIRKSKISYGTSAFFKLNYKLFW